MVGNQWEVQNCLPTLACIYCVQLLKISYWQYNRIITCMCIWQLHTSNLSSRVMVLKFFSLRKSHSFTTESSADVAK